MSAGLVVALVAAALAAIVHVYIWVLESLLWTTPRARRVFGIRNDAEAEHTRPLAFNQGFYNLFLAVAAGLGVGLAPGAGAAGVVGVTLIAVATGSMLAAAIVLLASAPRLWRGALVQGLLPVIALIALLVLAA